MDTTLFTAFTYDPDERRWHGLKKLDRFAPFAVRAGAGETADPLSPDEEEETLQELQGMTEQMRKQMREQFGPAVDQFFAALDEEMVQGPGESEDNPLFSPEEEAAFARQEARDQEEEQQRRKGLFPVHVITAPQAEPTPPQEAALRNLVEHQAKICKAVLAALFHSYKDYAKDARWRKMAGLPKLNAPEELPTCAQLLGVEITREHTDGMAYLIFDVDCDWEQEHGMYVVYHPSRKRAEWATGDSVYDLLESDEPIDDVEGTPPGNQELVDALLDRDEERVRQLLAAGHDINDVGVEDPYPPLCMAVEELDVDLVKRLLALGADPQLKDFENRTALQRAKLMLKTFAPPQGDKLMQSMLAMLKQANAPALGDSESKAREIVRLLEQARTK